MARRKVGDPLTVAVDGMAGPYIVLPLERVGQVGQALRDAGLPHTVDDNAVALDGRSVIAVIDLGRDGGAEAARRVVNSLNAAQAEAGHVAG